MSSPDLGPASPSSLAARANPNPPAPTEEKNLDPPDPPEFHGGARSLPRLLAWLTDTVIVLLCWAGLIALAEWQGLVPESFSNTNGARTLYVGLAILWSSLWEASAWQATPGKRLFNLVVRPHTGHRLGLGGALTRNAAKHLSLALCGLVALSADDGFSIWDRFSNTRVVRRHR